MGLKYKSISATVCSFTLEALGAEEWRRREEKRGGNRSDEKRAEENALTLPTY